MIRSGAAARHLTMSSGSPLTIPMMLNRFIASIVRVRTASSVRSGKIGLAQGGSTAKASPAAGPSFGSEWGITGNCAHNGGGFSPAYAAFRACKCMSMIGLPTLCACAAEALAKATSPIGKPSLMPPAPLRYVLDRDRRGDVRVRVVRFEGEILRLVAVDRLASILEDQRRQRPRIARQLQPRLLVVVRVQMAIAAGPHEHAGLEPALSGEHVGQQSVAGDVERHAEENVGAALVELQMEPPARRLGLEQAVAWGERHPVDLARVPGGDDLPARRGLAL